MTNKQGLGISLTSSILNVFEWYLKEFLKCVRNYLMGRIAILYLL